MNVISERRSRATGTTVQVVDNRDGSFDAGDLPWFTVCVDHGGVCSHVTRKIAESFAPVPDQWCPACQDAADSDHAVVSVDGWTCDRCGRQVNGQTDEDGTPIQEGDAVYHVA